MPGYLIQNANVVLYTPQGTISSTNVQSAIQELSSDISSVEALALLGL